jgi:hypothetical protein
MHGLSEHEYGACRRLFDKRVAWPRIERNMFEPFSWLTIICRLVLETLTPLPSERKCFRMINGILAERTVSDVLPALQTNADGLKKVLDDLVKQYQSKQAELEKWKVSPTSIHHLAPHTDRETEEEQYTGGSTMID